MFKKKKAVSSTGALKKKTMVCSTEAAAISIGIHILLIVFAGSIVVIKYVQKRNAAFSGENIARPKLERRQLQMPVKVQNLQKKSRRPKVTSRMASVSQASFSLPDTLGMGADISGEFDRSAGGERSLSSMGAAGSLGFGISSINFFGAKSKGEKMVFILDAGKLMVEDRKGGYFTYQFAKNRLLKMINGMHSATLFNVMVYSGNKTVMFSSKLVPATPENRESVKKWIAPLNSSPAVVSKLDRLPGEYHPPREYEDSPLDRLFRWVIPIQAAMEQRADNIFLLCSGYGIPRPSEAFLMEKYHIESKEKWLESRGWNQEKLAGYDQKRAERMARARQKLAEENRIRQAKGQPPKIVQDWWYYTREELQWPWEDKPHLYSLAPNNIVEPDWIIEHLKSVYKFNYVPQKLSLPAIHIVKLIASDGSPVDPPGNENCAYRLVSLKKISKAFKGQFELLRGAKTLEDLLKNNDLGAE